MGHLQLGLHSASLIRLYPPGPLGFPHLFLMIDPHTLDGSWYYLPRHKFKSPTFWALTTGCDCSPES